MATTQDNRILFLDSPLGKDTLMLTGFRGYEGLSELFNLELDLISENHKIVFDDIVGQNVTISILLADGSERFINGLISRFGQGSGSEEEEADLPYAFYQATMVPWLWLLTKSTDCRIFQNLSVPDIVSAIFEDYPSYNFSLRLQGSYDPRVYTVQYRETDFNFVSRLLEDEGIYYFFEHENGNHTLILADSPAEHKPCPKQETATYQYSGHGFLKEDVLKTWVVRKEIQAGKYTLCDFNFETPNTTLKTTLESNNRLGPGEREFYDYPGNFKTLEAGDRRTTVRIEEEECRITTIEGSSNCRAFASGYRFVLKDYYRRDLNQKPYVLIRVEHEADQMSTFPALSKGATGETAYSNRFACIPLEVPFRPLRVTRKPVVEGVQTAFVVGPEGEEIYTDPYGRVKVLFHWSREGSKNGDATCWIRVGQSMAGNRWGGVYLPRVGHEVIVHFIEGDPDRPIVIGQVYNGINMAPYELPGEKTKTTYKSNSTPQGSGFNELRFEDKKGEEQVFIHAERNQDIRTKSNRLEWVGNDSHLIVKRDQLEKVERDRHLEVVGDHSEKVGGTISIQAGADVQEKVGLKHALDAGMEIHLKAGLKVIIESGVQISLKAGPSFVDIGPAGVSIVGPLVNINSGGAAGSGSGCSPDSPQPPLQADAADPGERSHYERAADQPTDPPPQPPPSPQARAFMSASESGTPFCDT